MRDRLTTCEVLRGRRTLGPDRWHACVVYAPRGELLTTCGDERWTLSREQGALLVSNARKRAELRPAPGALVVVVRVDLRALSRLLDGLGGPCPQMQYLTPRTTSCCWR